MGTLLLHHCAAPHAAPMAECGGPHHIIAPCPPREPPSSRWTRGAGGPAPGAGGLPQGVAAGTPLVVGERGDVRARPAVSPRPATTGGLGELPPVSRRRCRP